MAVKDFDRVDEILDQLCNDYAYAVHQPHARNGGLIGLAAAAIALGSVRIASSLILSHPASCSADPVQDLPRFLAKIVPPVLACFTDQDARVRYYACEAMYNIAKVAKGEILVYFNSIFDQLCKVCPLSLSLATRTYSPVSLAPTRSSPSRTAQNCWIAWSRISCLSPLRRTCLSWKITPTSRATTRPP